MTSLVYLVRHGEATSEAEDPRRPLTAEGRQEVTRIAEHLGRLRLPVQRIVHSGKLRAQQTAEILARYLTPASVEAAEGLAPLDDPSEAVRLIETATGPLMLVGHLPHLSRLASRLLGVDREVVAPLPGGGVLCLTRGEAGWQIAWLLTPAVVGGT
ncbi:Phosphohistidine phosphatase SixA [bacterium HR11]|nr:Phosphohistidine phosphatase SixA [bacterium HR11]